MIETSIALAELVARIAETARLGVDTEADSLHCYREKVCLVQVGLSDADEIVDPLAELDLSPLLDALSRTEIVLHGADFDLRMLYRLGLDAPGKLFDTVIAARLTGVAKFGYSALVAEHFGITLPKGSQKANWARRPLAPKISYRPLRGRYDEGPSKGPSISRVPASLVSFPLLPASGCSRG